MKTKRISTAVQRWGRYALTLLLACALMAGLAMTAAAREGWQGEVVDPAIPKPTVTIQGNLVVEKGKPTGFYELALCVRSGRTIEGPDPDNWSTVKELTEVEYAAALAAIEAGTAGMGVTEASYTLTYYPFRTATAAVNINADVLTAVDWAIQSVSYENYDATLGEYPSDATNLLGYRRGIDTDPKTQGYDTLGITEAQAFPDITTPNLQAATPAVAIDVEGDSRMFAATGQVDHYDLANRTALVTLSAQAPTNRPVILTEDTLLVVARFSYDLKRFPDVKVNDTSWDGDERNSASGSYDDAGFWLGWDKTTGLMGGGLTDKTPLTWLGESDSALVGQFDFTDSDRMAAMTRMGQSVWVHMETGSGKVEDLDTYFYYYLGAEDNQNLGQASQLVNDNGTPTQVPGITQPKTAGLKVLTKGSEENPVPSTPPATQAQYTYFKNLLRLKDGTLAVELVNHETFKKPSGVGGNIILFYDWDDKLIGSLNVGKGDVRAEVEAYVEENLVHPSLRPDSDFMQNAGKTGVDLDKLASLQREYTYRGKYAYTVGGDDAKEGVTDGKEYPLTNKLDYVFTKRVNTTLTQTENGQQMRYIHPYSLNDPALDPAVTGLDATEFPYVYGWAVVEDATAANGLASATVDKGDWKVMHDAEKLEDTWTTMGVGELNKIKRTTMTDPTLSTVGTLELDAAWSAPAFLQDADGTWTAGTRPDAKDYRYTLSGQNEYLRFADFSDITAELERYQGKNTLIVKAVYEEGESLMDGNTYTAITEPAYTKWNNVAANAGGSYRVQMTVERSYVQNGELRGTTRIRMPVVQQDTTIDYKWLSDPTKGINNDLENASFDVSLSQDETLYTQVDADNGEEITFSLALAARQNRVDYVLIERFNSNFVVGTQRSTTNNNQKGNVRMFIPDNYNYLAGADSDLLDDLYDPDFSTKEGSLGFVLFGTLGRFLEQATLYNHKEISLSAYQEAITFQTAQDANLRINMDGTVPGPSSNTVLRNAFLAAAAACETHKNDSTYDCWDVNLDCAKLTYHQAQWFLLDYQANPGADILPVGVANGQKLSFCHYHISCSGGHVPVAPTTWKELVDTLRTYNDAADGSDDKEFALADLEALELSALESLTSLRSNPTGRKFNNLDAFINALLTADAQLKAAGVDPSWVNLQYVILNGGPNADPDVMRDEGQESYWWYAGATTAPAVNDFSALLAAAEKIRTPVTTKDGDATFLPKSALYAATFLKNSAEYLTADSPSRSQKTAWVTLTDNLVPWHSETLNDPNGKPDDGDETMEYAYGRFFDMDTFLDLFVNAYNHILDAADAAGEDPPADNDAWWEAIQTKLLRDVDPNDNLGDYDGTGDYLFWWRGGNSPFRVTNLSTLVECVRRLSTSGTSDEKAAAQHEWDNNLTVAMIEGKDISQSLRWRGTDLANPMYPYTGADLVPGNEGFQKLTILDQLKDAVQRFDEAKAANPTLIMNWDRIQYLLLNPGPLPNGDVVDMQKGYYWWKDGNTTGTAVNITVANGVDFNLRNLLEATYRADFNDPGVLSSIQTAAANEDGTLWAFTRLITQKVRGQEFGRADTPAGGDLEPNANDTYDGPDTEDEAKKEAYPATSDAEVQAFLDLLAAFRDAAKTDQGISTAAGNYDLPNFAWQQVQYYVLEGSYIASNTQAFIEIWDYATAKYGDYWWYHIDQRVPPEAPRPDVPDPPPNTAASLLNDLITIRDTSEDPYTDLENYGYTFTPDMFADWGIVNLDGSPITDDEIAIIQTAMSGLFDELDGWGLALEDLTWLQIQLMFGSCGRDWWWTVMPTEAEALDWLVNVEGAMLVSDGGYIPDEYGQIYPEIFGLEFSLRPADLEAEELGQAPDMTLWAQRGMLLDRLEAEEQTLEELTQELTRRTPELLGKPEELAALARQVADQADRVAAVRRELDAVNAALDEAEDVGADVPIGLATDGNADVGADVPIGPTTNDNANVGADVPIGPEPDDNANVGADVPIGPETNGDADVGADVPMGPASAPDTPAAADYGEVEEVPLGEDAHPAAAMTAALCWKPQCDWRTALMA